MAKHGCHPVAKSKLMILSCAVVSIINLVGCIGLRDSNSISLSREEVIARKLRRAEAKIESLKERNHILRLRLKFLTRSGGVIPLASNETAESLDGFDSGVITDVPIDSRKPVKPNPPQKRIENEAEKNALDLRKLTQNSAVFPLKQKLRRREASSSDGSRPKESTETEKPKIEKFIGEQADQALLRTMLQQLKSADYSKADFSAAERTLKLLEKAYPESAALAESRFQMGLFHYRGRLKAKDEVAKVAALRAADFYLSEAQQMTVQSPHIQAGSALMRGVIARLLLNSGGETRNADIARKNFEFVLKQYPNTLEAQRAKRELASMDRRTW